MIIFLSFSLSLYFSLSLCQHYRKPDTTVTAREDCGLACLHRRRGLTLLLKLRRNPKIHVSTGEEHWAPGLSWRWGPRTRHRLEGNLERPLATHMETGYHWGNMRKTKRFSPPRKVKPFSTAPSWEKSHLPSWALKGSLTCWMQLKKFSNILISIQEEYRGSWHNSRKALFSFLISRWESIFLLRREGNSGLPITLQEEMVSTWKLRETRGVVPPFQKTPIAGSQHRRSYSGQGHAERPDRARQVRSQVILCLSIYPKTKICLFTVWYTILFWHYRGLSPTTFLWKMLTYSSSWSPAYERSVSAQIPLMAL